ncbi:hypothetical protein E3P81_00915 [Wallemia ichthyophaga]|nr:hypothetical protein E3P97_00916 [Wallemia ichthyophaga]TIB06324.1 hypothetical protein E3P96_00578 [Wallemia ichthyophaga]TIB34709.1 hypothetical protein E3P85_00770 [Wallemia ichthyophaga]TIB49292.1 hypothetical protein E3P82_00913 [Wallemia ichthyophaga]TIB53247.1 hypothetical protein E3P81_00915 [Wallemia ichthyophaga]
MDKYVELIETGISTVLDKESYLFTPQELKYFHAFSNLYYNHRIFLTKLLNRQPSKWHKLSTFDLNFDLDEILDDLIIHPYHETVDDADLAIAINQSLDTARVQGDQDAWKDLNFIQSTEYLNLQTISIEYLLNICNNQDLVAISTKFNCLPKQQTRTNMIHAILNTSTTQSTLTNSGGLSFNLSGNLLNQSFSLKSTILNQMGKVIRVNPPIHNLFNRLAFVYSRQSTLFSPPHQLLSSFNKRHYPQPTHTRTIAFDSRSTLIEFIHALNLEAEFDNALDAREYPEAQGLAESVVGRWEQISASHTTIRNWRARYSPGHVYTRLVHKLSAIYSRNKDYQAEVRLLKELLQQRVWRTARRGAWYSRLALVLMTHYRDDRLSSYTEALNICADALMDHDTHEIYKPDLYRRVARLEKSKVLNVAPEDRTPAITLRNPTKKYVYAVRDYTAMTTHSLWKPFFPVVIQEEDGSTSESMDVVRVEDIALQAYNIEGWQGLHTEGRIVRTIFVLALWDIIFDPAEGAFETPFQIAPLDLHDGDFYELRRDAIESRLGEICEIGAADLVAERYDAEIEKRTWAIAVNWDYERGQLVGLAECLGGRCLAQIFRVLCQDWDHRTGGMPDLVLWRTDTHTAKFAEVKGPGDTLSETQKVWNDVLLSTQCEVDLCHVVASNTLENEDDEVKIINSPPRKRKSVPDLPTKPATPGPVAQMKRSESEQTIKQNQNAIMHRSHSEQPPLATKNSNDTLTIKKNSSMPPPELGIGRVRTPSELNIDIPKSRVMRRKSSGSSSSGATKKKPRVRSESSIENYFNRV